MCSIHDYINDELERIWTNAFPPGHQAYDQVCVPLFYPPLEQDRITFVGSNPSLPNEHHLLERHRWHRFCAGEVTRQHLIDIQAQQVAEYQYFRPMHEIAEENGDLSWVHLDLYPYRHTNQAEALAAMATHNLIAPLEQLFRDAISQLSPRVIVVANAFASNRFQDMFHDQLRFNDMHGYHCVSLSRNKMAPTFFSSMLSGQRALDRGSSKRLRWHIRQALQNGCE